MTKKTEVVVSIVREGELWRGTVRKRGQIIASATRANKFGPCGVVQYVQQVAMREDEWIVADWVTAPDA
jgi:hypothetical protein